MSRAEASFAAYVAYTRATSSAFSAATRATVSSGAAASRIASAKRRYSSGPTSSSLAREIAPSMSRRYIVGSYRFW